MHLEEILVPGAPGEFFIVPVGMYYLRFLGASSLLIPELLSSVRFLGSHVTNNAAEYMALILSLRATKNSPLEVRTLDVFMDSSLIVNQVLPLEVFPASSWT